MAKPSEDLQDMADGYTYTANMDRSLAGLATDLGEQALARGDWGEAITAFGEAAKYYSLAGIAEAYSQAYNAVAASLRAAGL